MVTAPIADTFIMTHPTTRGDLCKSLNREATPMFKCVPYCPFIGSLFYGGYRACLPTNIIEFWVFISQYSRIYVLKYALKKKTIYPHFFVTS